MQEIITGLGVQYLTMLLIPLNTIMPFLPTLDKLWKTRMLAGMFIFCVNFVIIETVLKWKSIVFEYDCWALIMHRYSKVKIISIFLDIGNHNSFYFFL